jgi:uncharacterized membrane protein YphA (DoxX/SURF4 family)
MKIATIVVRSLMGALFIFASISYFFKLVPQPELTGAMKIFNDGLLASGYIMPTIKGIELVCGILLLTGRLVPLVLIILSPIIINIFLVHLLLEASGLPVGIFLVLANSFLAYRNKDIYAPLFKF